MKENRIDLWLALIIFVLNLIARLVHYQFPGLHMDEAFSGIQTYKILHGGLPISGMNNYTGPFFDYLRVPIFAFGQNLLTLRLLSLLSASLASVVLYFILRRQFNSKSAFVGALIFSLSNWFFLSSRIAWEVAFFPSIVILALFGFLSQRKILKFLAAILCTLAFWSHPLFIVALIPLIILVVIIEKTNRQFINLSIIIGGFVLGLIPRFLQIILRGLDLTNAHQQTGIIYKNFFLNCLQFLPKFYAGDIGYIRQFSKVNLPLGGIILILTCLIVIAGILMILFKQKKLIYIPLLFTIAGSVSLLLVCYLVPWITFRYLLIPLTFLSLAVCFLSAILAQYKYFQLLPIALIIVFAGSWYVNFYKYPTDQTIKEFQYGTIEDTNAHFLDSSPLYKCLKENFSSWKIMAQPSIARPLEFYDMKEQSIKIIEVENKDEASDAELYLTYQTENLPEGFAMISTCSDVNFSLNEKL